jgi:hypothetical protein
MKLETNLESYLAYCEAKGLGKCFLQYAENCSMEDIMEIGFNPNSGYVYIALENGISICSRLGKDVEFLVTNFDTGEETFFEFYNESIEFFEKLNNEIED